METHVARKVMFLRVPEDLHARILARQAPRESLNALACRLLAAGCDVESRAGEGLPREPAA